MEKREIIQEFVDKRAETVGVFGYGSGVFKQESYNDEDKPQIDLIFLVDDLVTWHFLNMEFNPNDYTYSGRAFIRENLTEKVKGFNGITYLTHVQDGNNMFKYGVMEVDDFTRDLLTWKKFYVAGRFHKPTLEIKSTNLINQMINFNREAALKIACLFCEEVSTGKELLSKLCGLSYIGDTRMLFAENPNKVENIVNGSYNQLSQMYFNDRSYVKFLPDGKVVINHQEILNNINELPIDLVNYLAEYDTDLSDIDNVRSNIKSYLTKLNRWESLAQTVHGVRINGVAKSVPYALEKIKKGFKR